MRWKWLIYCLYFQSLPPIDTEQDYIILRTYVRIRIVLRLAVYSLTNLWQVTVTSVTSSTYNICVTNCPRCSTHNCGQQCWTTDCYYFRRLYTVIRTYVHTYVCVHVFMCLVTGDMRILVCISTMYLATVTCQVRLLTMVFLLWLKETCSYIVVYVCFALSVCLSISLYQ